MRVILMAHGKQERLADLGFPKQLLPVLGDEPNLARTVRMLRAHGVTDVALVAGQSEFGVFARTHGLELMSLAEPGLYAEGVLQAASLWDGQDALLLHADVIFSRKALGLCVEDVGALRFVGRCHGNQVLGKPYGEMFAVRVPVSESKRFRVLVQDALNKWRGRGRVGLWQMYYQLIDAHRPRVTPWMVETGDWTDDVDSHEDLGYLPQLRALARAEEVDSGT